MIVESQNVEQTPRISAPRAQKPVHTDPDHLAAWGSGSNTNTNTSTSIRITITNCCGAFVV